MEFAYRIVSGLHKAATYLLYAGEVLTTAGNFLQSIPLPKFEAPVKHTDTKDVPHEIVK